MEGSDYTQRTLDFFSRRLFPVYGNHCGVVIQSMLRRSEQDVSDLIAMGARVRLCKGAYLEPAEVAFPDKADVDRNYVRLMQHLMRDGNYPGLATHDEAIIRQARDFAPRAGHRATSGSSSRCCTGCAGTSRTASARRAITCASTSPSGRSGILTSCGDWRSVPPTSPFILGNVVRESVPGR